MNTDPSSFAEVFEDAEKAVSGIKNEKLREIAFEKLVNHLLTGKPVRSKKQDEDDGEEEEDDDNKRTKKAGTKKRRARGKKSNAGTPKAKTDGPKAWITELVDEGFFKTLKSSSDIREELESRSHHLRATDLTLPLQSLCHERRLRRKKVAPEDGGKAVLHWVKW